MFLQKVFRDRLIRTPTPTPSRQFPLIISVHVPKAAGNTFSRYLLNVFKDGVLRDYGSTTPQVEELFDSCFEWVKCAQPNVHSRIRLISYGILDYKKLLDQKGIRVIHGHFYINKYLGIFPDATYVTWLREPLQRALSQYNYFKRRLMVPPDPTNILIYEGKLSFEEWMTRPASINLQQQFTGSDLSKFKFVGIAEEFERSLSIFRKLVNLEEKQFDFDVKPENVNPDKPVNQSYDELDQKTRSRFIELNHLDLAIYRAAVQRLGMMED